MLGLGSPIFVGWLVFDELSQCARFSGSLIRNILKCGNNGNLCEKDPDPR